VPDVSQFVDLTLDDRDPQALFEAFLADATSRFPDWSPREGDTEVVIAQSYAVVIAELIVAVNRLPGALLEALLGGLFELPRDSGAPPTGTITFTASDAAGHLLPAGTRLGYLQGDGTLATFTTDLDALIPPASTTGTAAVTGDTFGATLNGLAAGTPLQVLDAVAWLDAVDLEAVLAGGRDPETSQSYLTRGAELLATLTTTLVRPSQFVAAALAVPGVGRAFGIDLYDPVGPDPAAIGNLSLVLTDSAGNAVGGTVQSAVTAALAPRQQGGLAVHLLDPTLTVVDVTCSVHRDNTLTDATAAAAVQAALRAYLSPASWPFAGEVYVNELISQIRAVPGVDRVNSVTVPGGDLPLAGAGPLASAGVLTVAVTSG